MNTKAVAQLGEVILAAMSQRRTAAGIAVAVDAAVIEPLRAEVDRVRANARYWRQRYYTEASVRWDDELPPGGEVCAVCEQPVESEPCPEHNPRALVAKLTAEIERLRRPSYSDRHVWQVSEEDGRIDGLYATEDDGKKGSIDCYEEMEEPSPDYSWRKREDNSLELLVGGEPVGIYVSRQDVFGRREAADEPVPYALTEQASAVRGRLSHLLATEPLGGLDREQLAAGLDRLTTAIRNQRKDT